MGPSWDQRTLVVRAWRPLAWICGNTEASEGPGDESKVTRPGDAEVVPACDLELSDPSLAREE